MWRLAAAAQNSSLNKYILYLVIGELHVDDHACSADNTTLPDMYLQGTEFDDIGPCLNDIQVHNDVWSTYKFIANTYVHDGRKIDLYFAIESQIVRLTCCVIATI